MQLLVILFVLRVLLSIPTKLKVRLSCIEVVDIICVAVAVLLVHWLSLVQVGVKVHHHNKL
jgi:hypothetical protein